MLILILNYFGEKPSDISLVIKLVQNNINVQYFWVEFTGCG